MQKHMLLGCGSFLLMGSLQLQQIPMLNASHNTISGTFPGTCMEHVVMLAWFFSI